MRPITFKILLRTGADTGQALGSLFEIRGEAGDALAGAGFPWTFSSRVMGGTRRLELWSATPSPPEFHPLPEPPAETRSYRPVLGVDNDRLMLLDQGLAYNGAWEVPDSFAALAGQGRPQH